MMRIYSAIAVGCFSTICAAQVVQLPTFNTFGYSGTVVVPDGGGVALGGVGRAASSSQRLGPFGPRAVGRSMLRSTASAHVQIIDLAEMDRQILGADPQTFLRQRKAIEAAKLERRKEDPVEAAKQLVRDARRCVQKGNFKVADYYYRRAVAELPPELSLLAQQEYGRVMSRPPLAPVIAQASPKTR